jgi:hypothetical protein
MSFDPGALAAGAAAVVVSLVYGRSQWRLSRRAEHDAEIKEIVGAVLQEISGTPNPSELPELGAHNPAIRDMLNDLEGEISGAISALALLQEAFEQHIKDRHGPAIDEWVLRAIAAREREVAARARRRMLRN